MKKWHYPFLAFLIIGTIIILSQSKPAKPEFRKAQGLVFGTSYNITYFYNADLKPDIEHTLALVAPQIKIRYQTRNYGTHMNRR